MERWRRLILSALVAAVLGIVPAAAQRPSLENFIRDGQDPAVSTGGVPSFRAELSSQKVAYGSTEKIELRLNIRNLTSGELALLTWKLPFGEIEDDIFVVSCGGKRAPYIGRVYKRAPPTAADYVRIPAGKDLSGTFDLASSYAIDEGGDCTVQFQFKLSGVHARDAAAGLDSLSERYRRSGTVTSDPLFMVLDPRPRPIEPLVELPNGAPAEMTAALSPEDAAADELGTLSPAEDALADQPLFLTPEEEAAAAEEILAVLQGEAPQGEAEVEDPQEPVSDGGPGTESLAYTASYRSCSTTRQAQIKTAFTSAETYAKGAYSFLVNNPGSSARYTRWFGRFSTARHSYVKGHYSRMKNAMASKRFTFNCNCTKPSTFAYVYRNRPYEIWLCPEFWRARNTGRDSKAGTIVHEASHFSIIGNTGDYEYGVNNSLWLAYFYPDFAVSNADSHEYFVELK